MVGDKLKLKGEFASELGIVGAEATVIGFMPSSYVNRVLCRKPNGERWLIPLDMAEASIVHVAIAVH